MHAEFIINGNSMTMQCQEDEMLEDVYLRLLKKMNKEPDFSDPIFLYNGTTSESKVRIKDIISKTDRERKVLSIIVDNNEVIFIDHETIKCPECYEDADIEFIDYKFNLHCKNGHIYNNLSINAFKETQKILASKIICDICKKIDIGQRIKSGQFYKCNKCNIYICDNCEITHLNQNKKHKKQKKQKKQLFEFKIDNFECRQHNGLFNSYCKDCETDCCEDCKNEKNHKRCTIVDYC